MINNTRLMFTPFHKLLAIQPHTFSSLKLSQPQKTIRIPFQQQNKYYLNHLLEQNIQKQQLIDLHNDFIKNLLIQNTKAKQQFEKIQKQMKNLYQYIQLNILKQKGFNQQSQFIVRSHYYFKSQGKKLRPTMIKMLSQNLSNISQKDQQKIKKWGALVEMLHISSLAHDDIIDESPSRRGMESQHIKYGKKSAIFSANLVISKASQTIAEYNNNKLYQIYSITMQNLANGQIIQAVNKNKVYNKQNQLKMLIQTYIHKSYYKTAALMANSLRAVPVVVQKDNHQQELASFRIGQHFGVAFQLIDDIIDYTSTAQQMGKQNLADIIEGNLTGPVYFSLWCDKKDGKNSSQALKLLKAKNKTKQKAQQIKRWIMNSKGIQMSYLLADMHISKGLQYLQYFPVSNKQLWKYLGFKILSRTK